jgi:hypothetical protein
VGLNSELSFNIMGEIMFPAGVNSNNNNLNQNDKESGILLNAIGKVDVIAAQERAGTKTAERLLRLTIKNAEANHEEIDLAAVEQRIKALFEDYERRTLVLLKLIDEQGEEQARKVLEDSERCRAFFFVLFHGWEKARRRYGRWYVDKLMKEIRQSCTEEVSAYKKALRAWREVRRRYRATETEADWRWYKSGKGNRNSVAYRTKVDMNRRGGEDHFRRRRLMKYMAHELLSRQDERRRAKRELRAAQAAMTTARQRIYERMGIPLDLV